ILHATHWDAGKDAIIGSYTVHYEDKSQQTIPIVYGKDTSNWWYKEGCSKAPSHAVVAWTGTNEDARNTSGARIHLYMTTWKNPQPTREVVRIDFASTSSAAAPFCVAMTTEE